MHVFGQWEEAGVPGENPRIHGENKLRNQICNSLHLLTKNPEYSEYKSEYFWN